MLCGSETFDYRPRFFSLLLLRRHPRVAIRKGSVLCGLHNTYMDVLHNNTTLIMICFAPPNHEFPCLPTHTRGIRHSIGTAQACTLPTNERTDERTNQPPNWNCPTHNGWIHHGHRLPLNYGTAFGYIYIISPAAPQSMQDQDPCPHIEQGANSEGLNGWRHSLITQGVTVLAVSVVYGSLQSKQMNARIYRPFAEPSMVVQNQHKRAISIDFFRRIKEEL